MPLRGTGSLQQLLGRSTLGSHRRWNHRKAAELKSEECSRGYHENENEYNECDDEKYGSDGIENEFHEDDSALEWDDTKDVKVPCKKRRTNKKHQQKDLIRANTSYPFCTSECKENVSEGTNSADVYSRAANTDEDGRAEPDAWNLPKSYTSSTDWTTGDARYENSHSTLTSCRSICTASKIESPLKPSHVRCPVCGKQLQHEKDNVNDENINLHIDKCLLKRNRPGSKRQATLSSFNVAIKGKDDVGYDKCESFNSSQERPEKVCRKEMSASIGVSSRTDSRHLENEKTVSQEHFSVGDVLEHERTFEASFEYSEEEPFSVDNDCQMDVKEFVTGQEIRLDSGSDSGNFFTSSFSTQIVGRKYHKSNLCLSPQIGDKIIIEVEGNNPKDDNALLAILAAEDQNASKSSARLGHLPRYVSRHICPLLRDGTAKVEAFVNENPTSKTAPLGIGIQVIISDSNPSTGEIEFKMNCRRIRGAIVEIEKLSSEYLSETHAQSSGECLRKNFGVIMEIVKKQESRVLDEEERNFMKAYESLSTQAQSLFLRLSLRKGLMFRLLSLSYNDVPDVDCAAHELHNSKLMLLIASKSEFTESFKKSEYAIYAKFEPLGMYDIEDVIRLLTVPELMEILQRWQNHLRGRGINSYSNVISRPKSREIVVSKIIEFLKTSDLVGTIMMEKLFEVLGPILITPTGITTILNRLQRLFFLNEGQSLANFLARDYGTVSYPKYETNRRHAVFLDRQQLLQYEEALMQAEKLTLALEEKDFETASQLIRPVWAALDAGCHKASYFLARNQNVLEVKDSNDTNCDLKVNFTSDVKPIFGNDVQGSSTVKPDDRILPPFLRKFHAGWVYCLMGTAGISLLERQKSYREAAERLQQLLGGHCCPSKRGHWWLRLSINLAHLGRPTDSLEVAEAALSDESLSPGDRLALQRRILRLAKPPRRWRKPQWASNFLREPSETRIRASPLNSIPGVKSIFIGAENEPCSVEELALQHYSKPENGSWKGIHSEGGIWSTLFGLLFWEALFLSGIDDTFRTPFQTAPLDLDCEGFYEAREDCIERILDEILMGQASTLLKETWNKQKGVLCAGVQWNRWTLDELLEIVECIRGQALAAVCRLLAKDHASWTGGMPDLLLFRPSSRDSFLSEVKGPRDRLSDQQRAWITALQDAGFRCEVFKVVES